MYGHTHTHRHTQAHTHIHAYMQGHTLTNAIGKNAARLVLIVEAGCFHLIGAEALVLSRRETRLSVDGLTGFTKIV